MSVCCLFVVFFIFLGMIFLLILDLIQVDDGLQSWEDNCWACACMSFTHLLSISEVLVWDSFIRTCLLDGI